MPMEAAYLNLIANAGAAAATHLGLVDAGGTELAGGGYARMPVTWTGTDVKRPSADITFNIPASTTVAGWRAYSAASGGTNYGGAAVSPETSGASGVFTYRLIAASTGIDHD